MKNILSAGSVKIREEGNRIIAENAYLRVLFDKGTGLLGVEDAKTGRRVLRDAWFEVNGLRSSGGGKAFSVGCGKIDDDLGRGLSLTVEAAAPPAPVLLLKMALYEGKPFLSLAAGLRNTTESDISMKRASVLSGSAFPGFSHAGYQVLNGESDDAFTGISHGISTVSKNNLLALFGGSGNWHSCGMGGLTYRDFAKFFRVTRCMDFLDVDLWEEDPVGRLVEPGEEYLPDDRFYFDPVTADPFRNLEQYGLALRAAQKITLKSPTYLVLNHWYPSQERFGRMEERNSSSGTVLTMEEARRAGLCEYAPVAVRLEPDDYSIPNNQQGWWDDAHFAKYPSGGLTGPCDTLKKWGDAIREKGGACMIYCQSGRRSEDYALAHPGHMLFNDPHAKRSKGGTGWWNDGRGDECWGYDYTDPGFRKHLAQVYAAYRDAGIVGIKFDYPDTNWCYDGGFEDKKATAASAYRAMFRAAREGLGDGADIQGRLGEGDLSAGLITTKRTEPDMVLFPPAVTRSGLKWYKNRVIYNVDTDVKNPLNAVPNNLDGARAMFTMAYVVSGRLELGIYPSALDGERRHALTRVFPFHSAPRSARPADAFCGKKYPQVYDFEVTPAWHEVTFFNTARAGGVARKLGGNLARLFVAARRCRRRHRPERRPGRGFPAAGSPQILLCLRFLERLPGRKISRL